VIAVEIGVRLVEGNVALQPALVALVLAPELYGPLRQVSAQFHASADGLAAAARIFELVDAPAAVCAPERPAPARFGAIRFEAVSASYPGRGLVLDDVSFELRPGERVALVGPSGAGKTTLFSLLLRFAEPADGTIRVGDAELAQFDPGTWRRLLAWLPQRPRLEPGPVGAAIGDGDVAAAAAAAGAAGLLDRVVGEGGAGLSAGEVRRVALARALARDAPLLLLDEPTAHLDEASAAVVAEAVHALPRSRTVLVATHDPVLVDGVDRVIELDGGRIRVPSRSAA
jgi:ATP-binding cassette subfamily C protein CydD